MIRNFLSQKYKYYRSFKDSKKNQFCKSSANDTLFLCIYPFMKKLLPLLRLSAKEFYKNIKKYKYRSKTLQKNIYISLSFYSHIVKKPRKIRDMAERLAMFPFIPNILENGTIKSDNKKYIKITIHKKSNLS